MKNCSKINFNIKLIQQMTELKNNKSKVNE